MLGSILVHLYRGALARSPARARARGSRGRERGRAGVQRRADYYLAAERHVRAQETLALYRELALARGSFINSTPLASK